MQNGKDNSSRGELRQPTTHPQQRSKVMAGHAPLHPGGEGPTEGASTRGYTATEQGMLQAARGFHNKRRAVLRSAPVSGHLYTQHPRGNGAAFVNRALPAGGGWAGARQWCSVCAAVRSHMQAGSSRADARPPHRQLCHASSPARHPGGGGAGHRGLGRCCTGNWWETGGSVQTLPGPSTGKLLRRAPTLMGWGVGRWGWAGGANLGPPNEAQCPSSG